MALRIIKATEPLTIEQLVLCIYSPPGIGKTSLAFTADKPLLLDFDGGAYRAGNRGDIVSVNSWNDAGGIVANDLSGYKTLIIDTAGRALDSLTADIIQGNPKLGRSGGALTLQGYGELKSRFIAFTKLVRSFGLDIVMLAHSDEQRGNGDDLIERIDVQGGSKNEIYKAADVMGRLRITNGRRVLNFSPTDTAFGKNPAGLAELAVPSLTDDPHFLGGVIADIKTALNRLTADQQEAAKALTEWQGKFAAVETADALNGLIPQAADAPESVRDNVKRLLVKAGKDKGFEWDADAKQFKTNGNGFNPLAQTTKDGITSKQAKDILALTNELDLPDADEAASKLFKIPVKVDDLSKEAASRLIADLTVRADNAGANF
ncbi:MAG TPA: ATP-binding protein [Pyrinomonadaceae bacterium]|nr:ATP-binding protein [Pyrinomonadaceae bacterium]